MTQANQAILDNLSQAVTAALNSLNAKKAEYEKILAEVRELQRQAEYHRSRGDNTNLQIVNGQLTAKYSYETAAKKAIEDAQKVYDKALADYTSAQNNLLSPEEKAAVLVRAKSEAETAKIEGESKLFIQKSTKYIIVGTIILVVIVVGVIIYRRKFKR